MRRCHEHDVAGMKGAGQRHSGAARVSLYKWGQGGKGEMGRCLSQVRFGGSL